MNTKCPICTRVKGKRDCLLKGGALICQKCCATLRSTETCSECHHFQEVEKHKLQKMINSGTLHQLAPQIPEVEDAVDRALIFLEQSMSSRAEELLLPLLQSHPENHSVHYGIGCLHLINKNFPEAVIHFKKATKIFPYFVEAWQNLSTVCRETEDFHLSITAAQKAVQLSPVDSPIASNTRKFLKNISAHLAKQGLTMEQFLANLETFDQAHSQLENGNYKAAIDGFHSVLETDKKHVQSHGNLALCYAMLGDKTNALYHLNKALDLDPEYTIASDNLLAVEKMTDGTPLDLPMQHISSFTTDVTTESPTHYRGRSDGRFGRGED